MKYRVKASYIVAADSEEEAFRKIARYDADVIYRKVTQSAPNPEVEVESAYIEIVE